MAKRIKVTHEGVTETEVEDGQTFMPEGVGVSLEDIDDTTPLQVEDATSDLLASLIGENDREMVDPVEILVGNKVLRFGVKTLSDRETSALLRKRLRMTPGGRMSPTTDADLILRIQTLHQCVRRNVGTTDAPQWVEMWSHDDVAGVKDDKGSITKKGLIDNTTPEAQEMKDQLLIECYSRNPTLHPLFLESREQAIAERVNGSVSV